MKKFLSVIFTMSMALHADVSITSASYQEEIEITPSGEKIVRWVKAHKVVPKSIVRYVNQLENKGDREAQELIINNPIPENMLYISGSASCQSHCQISYSVDGGLSFYQPEELYVGVGQARHIARASEYTNIRWIVDRLPASSQSSVEYSAQLK